MNRAIGIAIAIAIAGCREKPSTRTAPVLAKAGVLGAGWAAVSRHGASEIGAAGLATATAPATEDTVFQAASIGKPIIATCVMQLVEKKKLDLDADVSGYVGFDVKHPKHREPITLRLLLSHRASIADHDDELLARAESATLGDFLRSYLVESGAPRAKAYREEAPGVEIRYSNVGAALAALAVERVSGASFADVAEQRLFAPLGMRSTSYKSTSARRATPHALRRDPSCAGAWKADCFTPLPPPSHAVYPVVDLHTSARDLSRFAAAVLRGGELDGARILEQGSVRLMLAPVAGDGAGEQALGWQIRTIGGARVAGHEGEDAGATTAMFLDEGAGTGALVLANGDAFGSGDPARAAAISGFLGELFAAARRSSSPPVSSADAH
ncbi:MAG: beta-lactamase family protein [Labilithrix sp.]|nr:beta-lactamase family protein [Labilithrix sp.]